MKTTRAAKVRRRRLATTVSTASLLTVGIVLAIQLPAHSHADGTDPTPDTARNQAASSSLVSGSVLKSEIQSYVAHRRGAISVAVYDNVAQELLVVHPSLRGRTASIVKADILETLLHRTEGHLSRSQRATAKAMIENSDNTAATELWNQDGAAAGVKAYNDLVGLTSTAPNFDWGLTTTTATDQVRLVRELFSHSDVLTEKARAFQRHLMRNVEADQRWGIGDGVPSDATFGTKNGWLPVDEDHGRWAVNSIGWVRGDGKRYEIAVITQHDATESYGKRSIRHVSTLVWNHMTVGPNPTG